jgi:hypothetical protein
MLFENFVSLGSMTNGIIRIGMSSDWKILRLAMPLWCLAHDHLRQASGCALSPF